MLVQIFCEVAYKAKTAQDLISGIDEFMDDLTVLPPSVWDPQTRLEPPTKSMSVVQKNAVVLLLTSISTRCVAYHRIQFLAAALSSAKYTTRSQQTF